MLRRCEEHDCAAAYQENMNESQTITADRPERP